jgi:hypothetical protein
MSIYKYVEKFCHKGKKIKGASLDGGNTGVKRDFFRMEK